MSMPKVNMEMVESASLNMEERDIVNIVVKKNTEVRASKPKVKDDVTGKAAYVWRMVCFSVSPKHQHHCMPVCADFDLPARNENGKWSSALAREMAKELNKLVDLITDAIPKEEWYGIHRWGKAFGMF